MKRDLIPLTRGTQIFLKICATALIVGLISIVVSEVYVIIHATR